MNQTPIIIGKWDGSRSISSLLEDYPELGITQEVINYNIRYRFKPGANSCGVWISEEKVRNIAKDLFNFYFCHRHKRPRGKKYNVYGRKLDYVRFDDLYNVAHLYQKHWLPKGENYLKLKRRIYEQEMLTERDCYTNCEKDLTDSKDKNKSLEFYSVSGDLRWSLRSLRNARRIAIGIEFGSEAVIKAELAHYRLLSYYFNKIKPLISEKENKFILGGYSESLENPKALAGRYFSQYLTDDLEKKLISIVETKLND